MTARRLVEQRGHVENLLAGIERLIEPRAAVLVVREESDAGQLPASRAVLLVDELHEVGVPGLVKGGRHQGAEVT